VTESDPATPAWRPPNDLDRGTVSVSHTLEWRKGGWQFAETKRSRSRRLIRLQAWVVVSAIIQKRIFLNGRRIGNIIRAEGAIIRPIIRARGDCSQPSLQSMAALV
jgi:hypothetical protein